MGFNDERREIIEGVRGIRGCEDFTEQECLEVWEESILLGMIEE